jgi:hypothetical protein
LDRGEQQPDHHADDRDHDKKFDEREAARTAVDGVRHGQTPRMMDDGAIGGDKDRDER